MAKSKHDKNFRKFFDLWSKIFCAPILAPMITKDVQFNIPSSTNFLKQSDNHFLKIYIKNSCFSVKKRCGLFALRRVAESKQGNVLYFDAKLKMWETIIILYVVRFNNKFCRYRMCNLKKIKIKQNGFFRYYYKSYNYYYN